MRKKVARVVFSMVLLLAVATSFMASAVEARAEEGRQGVAAGGIEGDHYMVDNGSYYEYEQWNSEYHFFTHYIRLKCRDCSLKLSYEEKGHELHDLRGVSQAPLRWHCVSCGYEE